MQAGVMKGQKGKFKKYTTKITGWFALRDGHEARNSCPVSPPEHGGGIIYMASARGD